MSASFGGFRLGILVAGWSALGGLSSAGACWLLGPDGVAVAVGLSVVMALIGAAWVSIRLTGPVLAHLEAARAFIHHDGGARAAQGRGGRQAREVARTINALIDRAVWLQEQGRSAREADIQQAALAIGQLGLGNLRDPPPTLGAPFRPVGQALALARRNLLERVARLHDSAGRVASAGADGLRDAQTLAEAGGHQRRALEQLIEGATDVSGRLRQFEGQLSGLRDHDERSVADAVRTLADVSQVLLRSAELASRSLQVTERGARAMESAARHVAKSCWDLTTYLPELALALEHMRIGTSFEEALLERLARQAEEIDGLHPADALTSDGRAAVVEIQRAAASARARVDTLIDATEATLAALRPESRR